MSPDKLTKEQRTDLALLARDTDNPELRTLAVDILRGRRPYEALMGSTAFRALITPVIAELQHAFDELTDDERAELFDPDRQPTDEDRAALADAEDDMPPISEHELFEYTIDPDQAGDTHQSIYDYPLDSPLPQRDSPTSDHRRDPDEHPPDRPRP